MIEIRYANIIKADVANGEGMRVSLFLQGCSRHCKGCFNENTWDFDGGFEFTDETKTKLFSLIDNYYIKGLSVLGGEPLEQSEELEQLLKEFKAKFPDKDVWLWTGFKYEDVKDIPLFNYVDYVVDGEFVELLKDKTLKFRGSSNQRIIKIGD